MRTIFDGELEHDLRLLALEDSKVVLDDFRRKIERVAELYDEQTVEYWVTRYENLENTTI
jgi:hypothetical protein